MEVLVMLLAILGVLPMVPGVEELVVMLAATAPSLVAIAARRATKPLNVPNPRR
jgi:hypothetical protein